MTSIHNDDNTTQHKSVQIPSRSSSKSTTANIFEWWLRRFKSLAHAITVVPLIFLGCICLGGAIAVGIFCQQNIFIILTQLLPELFNLFYLGFSIAAGFFAFGFSLILIVPAVNFILRCSPKPWRGPYYSYATAGWYIHNGLTYLVRYTFLNFITPTPFSHLFYKLMGMKLGKDCQINTENISDPALIEIGDRVTVGGSVTIIGHYGVGGYLILSKVKVGNDVTIGLKASILGGVEIGDGAKILPHSAVLPKTKVPAGEIWGGVPAKKIEKLE